MKQLVLASSNPGKLREFGELLASLGIEVVPQGALGVSDAEEPHATFVENALAKARNAARHAKLPALADDSGICVAALDGEPGVWAVGGAVRALRRPLLGPVPLEDQRDQHQYRGDLTERPGDAARPVLVAQCVDAERGRRVLVRLHHRRGRHHQRDAEEGVEGHGGEQDPEPGGRRQPSGRGVDADERPEEQQTADEEVQVHEDVRAVHR